MVGDVGSDAGGAVGAETGGADGGEVDTTVPHEPQTMEMSSSVTMIALVASPVKSPSCSWGRDANRDGRDIYQVFLPKQTGSCRIRGVHDLQS